jgi:hypothetical protein
MRKKALLVAAKAGCSGPAVVLDSGVWEVVEHPAVKLRWEDSSEWERIDGKLRFKGRARITSSVLDDYEGDAIHLDIVQVA